jgi:PAT family beta-lactamase induction signal transducer AmpG
MLVCGVVPPTRGGLLLLSGFVFLISVGSTLVGQAIESLIPHHTPDDRKGRASGWFEAGNLGGLGLGGGAALWMAQHVSPSWTAAATLAGASMLCAFALAWIPPTPGAGRSTLGGPTGRGLVREQYARLALVLKRLWSLARSRHGCLGLLVVFLPLGTGAASNLWAAVADSWHASADAVALVNGALGGVASMLGALVAGPNYDRLDRKFAYVVFGVLQALCAVAMALAPHTASMYMLFTLAYAILNGMVFAGYSAVALEAIDLDAAATQFDAYASLSNMPALYMGLVEGWAYTQFGASGMLYAEALIAAAAVVVFFAASTLSARLQPRSTGSRTRDTS